MFGYFSEHPLFSGTPLLSGEAEGLFENGHIEDLLDEGYRPTEYHNGLGWVSEWPSILMNPEEPDPVRWRDERNRICHVTFMGVRFRHRDWRAGNCRRRKEKGKFRERLRQARQGSRGAPSFTYLLHLRAEEHHCKVTELLITHLRFATFEDPEVRNRWDGELGLLKQALEWEGFPFKGWNEQDPATFAPWKWQSFWEWWTEHVHPRL